MCGNMNIYFVDVKRNLRFVLFFQLVIERSDLLDGEYVEVIRNLLTVPHNINLTVKNVSFTGSRYFVYTLCSMDSTLFQPTAIAFTALASQFLIASVLEQCECLRMLAFILYQNQPN